MNSKIPKDNTERMYVHEIAQNVRKNTNIIEKYFVKSTFQE